VICLLGTQAEITRVEPQSPGDILPEVADDECWQFTWAGAFDDDGSDDGKTCDDFRPADVCFPPLVFTNPNQTNSNGLTGPDLNELQRSCNADNGTVCTCKKEPGEVCVKYTKMLKNGISVYFSSFCGSGVNSNNFNTHVVERGCHKQTNLVENDREVCFCNSYKCNRGSQLQTIRIILIAALFCLKLLA